MPLEEAIPSDDLLERNAREFAKRAVLDVLDGGRIVEAAVLCTDAAGVECTGEEWIGDSK
jgi:hypothetical protein